MSTEPPKRPPAEPKPTRVRTPPEDLDRYGDEEQMRAASDERRLRDERPPHHG